MPPDDGKGGAPPQNTPPAGGGDDAAAAAERRARDAEEKASRLEAEQRKRDEDARRKDDEKKRRKAADLDTANTRIAELEKREQAALDRIKALETKQIDTLLAPLDDEQKKIAEKYRAKMPTDDFIELVQDMFKPTHGAGASDEEHHGPGPAPPAAAPRGPGPKLKTKGRELHAETVHVLRQHMNEEPDYAQQLLEKAHSGTQYRYIVPVDNLIRFMRERVAYTKRISPEQKRQMLDAVTRRS